MLTQEDDVEIHALAKRGWSIAAIARHTGRASTAEMLQSWAIDRCHSGNSLLP